MDGALQGALVRLAHRLEAHLTSLRTRGRTRHIDSIGGLAIEPGDAEGLLAELGGEPAPHHPRESLSADVPALQRAAERFELSPFERDVLLLALAPELDARFCRLFGFLNDSVVAFRPTVGLALVALGGGPNELASFLPESRLLRDALLETEGDGPLAGRALRIPRDFWPQLAGLAAAPSATTRLDTLVLAPSTATRVRAVIEQLRIQPYAIVAIHGAHGRTTLARAMAAELGPVIEVEANDSRRGRIRDAIWHGGSLVAHDDPHTARVPVFIVTAATQLPALAAQATVPIHEIEIRELDRGGRAELWRRLGATIDPDELAARHRFDPGRITAAMALARSRATTPTAAELADAVRAVGNAGSTRLAAKLATDYELDDLVVPRATRTELALFETAARSGPRLFADGGHGDRIRGARGFAALFAGGPGTGKTMAAQIVARRLDAELLRIDLSQVVNKYIGETEKHLDAVFDEAERSGALLFFDEADALFGKRTQVRDAHDRYANLETAFLLQRLEQHAGISILATNLANNLDAAFLRRLHFVIEFPVPAAADRRAIWERHVRATALASDVDLEFLARFELAGGDIRNAVVAAVLFAATSPQVEMRHLVIATSRELRKAGRLTQPEQFGPWSEDVLAHLRG